jgi:dTDP-4-amino-4,6-dideoxygalactose transaminase
VKRFIHVSAPALFGNGKAYVLDSLVSTRISSSGHYVERFVAAFTEFCNVKHAIPFCNTKWRFIWTC